MYVLTEIEPIREAARGFESVFCNFRQRHSRNSSDSRFRAKRCVSDEISKASDLDMGDRAVNCESAIARSNQWELEVEVSRPQRDGTFSSMGIGGRGVVLDCLI